MWTQIVGKIRMQHMPLINHWWQATLYVTPRGLSTGAIPYRNDVFDVEFDFVDHVLAIRHSEGGQRIVTLAAKPVAQFYGETLSALDSLGVESHIVASPNEVDPAIPFAEDDQHAAYDADAVRTFWRQLVQAHRVIGNFRASFVGKWRCGSWTASGRRALTMTPSIPLCSPSLVRRTCARLPGSPE
jgi:hypothetical protein